jgi:hypothetical protein
MNTEQSTVPTVVAPPTRDERIAREIAKEHQLRTLATANWGKKDLLEIFGLGLVHRLRTVGGEHKVGKNYFTKHFHAGKRNPAGSKLLRRFIRQSKKEQHKERKMYAALTGRQYDHLNNPEQ